VNHYFHFLYNFLHFHPVTIYWESEMGHYLFS